MSSAKIEPPFVVGRPATGEYFVDRENEIGRLLTLVQGVQTGASSNCVLVGLRRTGKTSILNQLSARLGPEKRLIPVIVNCYGIASKSRLAKMVVDSVIESYVGKTGDGAYLRRFKKIVNEVAGAAVDRIDEVRLADFTLKLRDIRSEDDSLLEDALQYAESLGQEKGVYFVLMLDEFQEIIRWGDDTLKRIRTVIQGQSKMCYVLAGSITTVMHTLVYDRRSPFYRQLVEIPVGKLDKPSVISFVERRLSIVGITPSPAVLDRIAMLSEGYPDYVQRIGLEIFLSAGFGGSVTEGDVDRLYEQMLVGLDGEFDVYFRSLSPLEREILVAVAIGKTGPAEMAREVRKPITNISKTLSMLINCGIIERPMAGRYRISDPIFSDWLNRRFRTVT